MIILGIDPGKHGAISTFRDGKYAGVLSLYDLSVEQIKQYVNTWSPFDTAVFLEEVHASPQQGVVSAFTFGRGFGQLEGLLTGLGYYTIKVKPMVWQSAIGCMTGGDKKITTKKAKELFPSAYFKAADADAILIGWYGVQCDQRRRRQKQEHIKMKSFQNETPGEINLG